MPFRFIDRWQQSLGHLLRILFKDAPPELDQFLSLSERRDRDVENYIDGVCAPNGRWRRAATQNIPNATDTAISWDTADKDEAHMVAVHATTGTVVRLTRSGSYQITVTGGLSAVSAGRAILAIKPASTVTGVPALVRSAFIGEDQSTTSATVPFNAQDAFTVGVYQASGGALTWTGWLHVVRIADL